MEIDAARFPSCTSVFHFITALPREKNLVCFQLVPLVIHSPLLRVMPVWPFLPSFHEEL